MSIPEDRQGPDEHPIDLPRPWGFWLLIVLTVLYLGWRAVQGVLWLIDRI